MNQSIEIFIRLGFGDCAIDINVHGGEAVNTTGTEITLIASAWQKINRYM